MDRIADTARRIKSGVAWTTSLLDQRSFVNYVVLAVCNTSGQMYSDGRLPVLLDQESGEATKPTVILGTTGNDYYEYLLKQVHTCRRLTLTRYGY